MSVIIERPGQIASAFAGNNFIEQHVYSIGTLHQSGIVLNAPDVAGIGARLGEADGTLNGIVLTLGEGLSVVDDCGIDCLNFAVSHHLRESDFRIVQVFVGCAAGNYIGSVGGSSLDVLEHQCAVLKCCRLVNVEQIVSHQRILHIDTDHGKQNILLTRHQTGERGGFQGVGVSGHAGIVTAVDCIQSGSMLFSIFSYNLWGGGFFGKLLKISCNGSHCGFIDDHVSVFVQSVGYPGEGTAVVAAEVYHHVRSPCGIPCWIIDSGSNIAKCKVSNRGSIPPEYNIPQAGAAIEC